MKFVIIITIAFIFLFFPTEVFAESETFTVAARDYEQKGIYLNTGDELSFSIQVRGGANDDLNMIIGIPGEDIIEGLVVDNHSDEFTASSSGTFVFTFDNTISKISNKSVLFSYEITQNTYYMYIENIPEYAKAHASNAVFDATKYWKSVFPKMNFYVADSQSDADIIIQWVKDFTGVNHVGFQYMQLVEIGLGDSSCLDQWNPYSSNHVTKITTHEIGHAIGLEHSDNPNSIMYYTVSMTQYGQVSEQFNMGKNQGTFIPLCLSQEPASIQYSVETTDTRSGFDVYVVPGKEYFDKIMQGESFVYYSDDCSNEGYLEYFAECKGIVHGSGLVIVHDHGLSSSTASITVKYAEIDYDGYPSPTDTKIRTQIHETAVIYAHIFEDQFDFTSSYFQNKDDSIRFEDGNGYLIHRYAEFANLGQLFNSFGMSLTKDCFIFPDGRSFCNNENYYLEFYVNGEMYSSLEQYVINDGDVIEIIYGSSSKPVPSIQTETNVPIESRITESVEKYFETINNIECGLGTIEKNGQCVVDNGKSSKGGGCLIATATYGSELAPQVQQLRELRDNSLLQTESGVNFMNSFNDFYYSFSPIIADYERENTIFREVVKIAITPMIYNLSILNYVDMDSEESVLGYGISLIVLNLGMYIGIPAILIIWIRKRF